MRKGQTLLHGRSVAVPPSILQRWSALRRGEGILEQRTIAVSDADTLACITDSGKCLREGPQAEAMGAICTNLDSGKHELQQGPTSDAQWEVHKERCAMGDALWVGAPVHPGTEASSKPNPTDLASLPL